jgi:O-antigen ligase
VAPVALLAATLVAVAGVSPMRDRLLEQDRTPIWRRVAVSASTAPVLGQGPGSSQIGPALRYWWQPPPDRLLPSARRYEWWQYWAPHPHNEYLRVLHDLGAVGAALFGGTLAAWMRTLYQGWRRASATGEWRAGALELGGLLALVALLLVMMTDNPLVYPFVIAPVGVLIGTGLGAAAGRG